MATGNKVRSARDRARDIVYAKMDELGYGAAARYALRAFEVVDIVKQLQAKLDAAEQRNAALVKALRITKGVLKGESPMTPSTNSRIHVAVGVLDNALAAHPAPEKP